MERGRRRYWAIVRKKEKKMCRQTGRMAPVSGGGMGCVLSRTRFEWSRTTRRPEDNSVATLPPGRRSAEFSFLKTRVRVRGSAARTKNRVPFCLRRQQKTSQPSRPFVVCFDCFFFLRPTIIFLRHEKRTSEQKNIVGKQNKKN